MEILLLQNDLAFHICFISSQIHSAHFFSCIWEKCWSIFFFGIFSTVFSHQIIIKLISFKTTILYFFQWEKDGWEIFSFSLFVQDPCISAPSSLPLSVFFQLQHGRKVESVTILWKVCFWQIWFVLKWFRDSSHVCFKYNLIDQKKIFSQTQSAPPFQLPFSSTISLSVLYLIFF
jgi:hypothetical protein